MKFEVPKILVNPQAQHTECNSRTFELNGRVSKVISISEKKYGDIEIAIHGIEEKVRSFHEVNFDTNGNCVSEAEARGSKPPNFGKTLKNLFSMRTPPRDFEEDGYKYSFTRKIERSFDTYQISGMKEWKRYILQGEVEEPQNITHAYFYEGSRLKRVDKINDGFQKTFLYECDSLNRITSITPESFIHENKMVFEYTDNKCTKVTSILKDGSVISVRSYIYEQDRISKEIYDRDDRYDSYEIEFIYNELGSLVGENRYKKYANSYSLAQLVKYEYAYDQRGNWIRKRGGISDSGSLKDRDRVSLNHETRREIIYL